MWSDGVSDVHFNVALILSKWRRHQIIIKVLLLEVFLLVGYLTEPCLFMNGPHSKRIFRQTKSLVGKDVQKRDYNPQKIECKHNWKNSHFFVGTWF